jgi:hypothetical protein
LEVKINSKKIKLPKESYKNLFNPNFSDQYIYVLYSKDKIYKFIYMQNGDSSGAYEVIWIFKENKFLNRIIAHGL